MLFPLSGMKGRGLGVSGQQCETPSALMSLLGRRRRKEMKIGWVGKVRSPG